MSQLTRSSFRKIFGTDIEKALLFLVVLFLPTQLGKHFFFDFSYIFSLKIDYYSFIVYFWDILTVLLFISFLMNNGRIKSEILKVLIIFLITQSISILINHNYGNGLVRFEQYIITSLFGLYLASKKVSETGRILYLGLLGGIIFEGFLAFIQFLSGKSTVFWILGEREFNLSTPLIATFNWYGEMFLRPYGTFSHPNILAAYFVTTLPFLLYLYFKFGKPAEKKILGISLVIGFMGTILTFSRTAALVLGIQSIIFLKGRVKLMILIALILFPFLLVRFESALNFDSLSITRREELAEVAINLFYTKPVFGVGLNNFIAEIAHSSLVSGSSRFLQPAHNIFLLTLSETGLIGLSGFLIFFFYPLYLYLNSKSKTKRVFICLFAIIAFLGLFDHYFLTLPQGLRILFLVWGAAFGHTGHDDG